MLYQRLIAIDPSLTCSGWALFDIRTGHLQSVGKIKSISSNYQLADRLDDLFLKVNSLFEILSLNFGDVLIVEDATTMRDPDAVIKVEQVRGIFENSARAKGLSVPGRINSRTIHAEIFGLRGKQLPRNIIKAMAVSTVQKVFASTLEKLAFDCSDKALNTNQDIVDAILLGHLATSKVKMAQEGDFDLKLCFEKSRRGTRNKIMRSSSLN